MKTFEECMRFIQMKDCRVTSVTDMNDWGEDILERPKWAVRIHCGGTTFLLGWDMGDADFVLKLESEVDNEGKDTSFDDIPRPMGVSN
jgi:hypothetical protein